MITKDDFLDIIHANTTAITTENGETVIVLEDKNFSIVIEGILRRFLYNIQNSIELS